MSWRAFLGGVLPGQPVGYISEPLEPMFDSNRMNQLLSPKKRTAFSPIRLGKNKCFTY